MLASIYQVAGPHIAEARSRVTDRCDSLTLFFYFLFYNILPSAYSGLLSYVF